MGSLWADIVIKFHGATERLIPGTEVCYSVSNTTDFAVTASTTVQNFSTVFDYLMPSSETGVEAYGVGDIPGVPNASGWLVSPGTWNLSLNFGTITPEGGPITPLWFYCTSTTPSLIEFNQLSVGNICTYLSDSYDSQLEAVDHTNIIKNSARISIPNDGKNYFIIPSLVVGGGTNNVHLADSTIGGQTSSCMAVFSFCIPMSTAELPSSMVALDEIQEHLSRIDKLLEERGLDDHKHKTVSRKLETKTPMSSLKRTLSVKSPSRAISETSSTVVPDAAIARVCPDDSEGSGEDVIEPIRAKKTSIKKSS
jgi:hypothetical protein